MRAYQLCAGSVNEAENARSDASIHGLAWSGYATPSAHLSGRAGLLPLCCDKRPLQGAGTRHSRVTFSRLLTLSRLLSSGPFLLLLPSRAMVLFALTAYPLMADHLEITVDVAEEGPKRGVLLEATV